MSEAAYLDAPYERRFEATVERVLGDRLALSRTLFYPTGGGQPHDTGRLRADGETYHVVDVERRDRLYHTVEPDGKADLPSEGTSVTGELDWDRRYAHMRYHTTQHLLSALLLDEYDAPTVGNQLHADRARIDCAHERFEDADLDAVETRMNDLVESAMTVRTETMSREEAAVELDPERTRLDLLPASVTEVRIVTIGNYDRTACAGTHVRNTDEIGTVTVTGRETGGAGRERLRFRLA